MILVFKLLFQKYLKYSIKNTGIVCFLLFLEHIPILFFILNSIFSIFENERNRDLLNIYKNIFTFSPLDLAKKLVTCYDYSDRTLCYGDTINLIYLLLISLFVLITLISFIYEDIYLDNKSIDNTAEKLVIKQGNSNRIYDTFSFCFVNLLDFILHVMTISLFFYLTNEIFAFFKLLEIHRILNYQSPSGIKSSLSVVNYVKLLIAIVLMIFWFFLYVLFVKNINLIIQYNKDLSTHYDNLFSTKYDFLFLVLKLLIAISESISTNNIMSQTSILFLNVFILLLYIGFNLFMLSSAILYKNILFLMNKKFNLFRIFLLNFSFCIILCFIVFYHIIYENYIYAILSLVFSLSIGLFLYHLIEKMNSIAIYSTDNYIFQMIYILNIKYNSTLKELYSEISNIIFYHKNYCIYYSNCEICKIENFDIDNFLRIFYERIREIIKSKGNVNNFMIFNKNDRSIFNIIKLLIVENLYKNKIIKLIYKARRIIEKYEITQNYDNKYFNLIIYNNYMRRLISKNQVLKFKIIQCYEDTSLHIDESLKLIDTLTASLSNGDKYIFQKSSKLFELKSKITKNVQFLSFYQNYFVDTYLIIIYRFIYKNLFNCEINDFVTIYNFDEIKDIVDYMFENEKLIQIKLNFNDNSMRLIRLGKDLINFRNKSFDDLIPREFKQTSMDELIKTVKSSDNEENKTFEYVITDDEKNLKSIKINFTILTSFKLDEVTLIGQYEVIDHDLILLRKLDNSYSNNLEKNSMEIVNFSQNLNEIFYLKSSWLDRIKLKYKINLNDIFEEHKILKKIDENAIVEENIQIEKATKKSANKNKNKYKETPNKADKQANEDWKAVLNFTLNYDRYSTVYQKILLYVEEELNFEELNHYSKLFRKNLKKENKKQGILDIYYSLTPKYIITKESQNFILYNIKKIPIRTGNLDPTKTNRSLRDLSKKIEITDGVETEIERIHGLIKETESVSSSTKSYGNRTEAIMAADSSRKTILSNDLRMNKFTIFSLLFCIFLVVYCIFFLVIGLINNNNIRKLYMIRNSYNDFRYFFYHTAMNFFFNIAIYNQGEMIIQNSKKSDSFFFQKFTNQEAIQLDIPKYINEELSIKLNMLRDIYVKFQNEIYSSHYKEKLDGIFNTKSDFLQLSTISNELYINQKQFYFFETINIFFNHGKIILENISDHNFIYLYIVNSLNGIYNFSAIGDNDLSEIQIKMYEILLNYINYYRNFLKTGVLINEFFTESLTSVFNMTYLLSFLLMGIHLFLFFGCILIVNFLYRIVRQNEEMLKKINEAQNLLYLNEKIKNIKILSLLFIENPKKTVNKLHKNRTEYFKLIADSEKKSKIEDEKKELIKKDKQALLDVKIIALPFTKLLTVIFFIYYIYSLIFYFIFKNSYEEFIITSNFSNHNIDLDNKMMNNINLLATIMLLNKTEYDLSYELEGEKNRMMMELLTNILKIRIDIKKYKKSDVQFKIIDDLGKNLMNCTYIYYELSDDIFNRIQLQFNYTNLIKSLENICKTYNFMGTGKLDSIFDEISYNSLDLYTMYDNSGKSYNEIKLIYEDYKFYDVFLIFILIFRPIRKFSSDYIYNNIIMVSSTNYLIFTVVYLILNIIVDLTIFYVINRHIVKKISDINKHLNNMIGCLSYKFSENMKNK